MTGSFLIEALGLDHDRTSISSGVEVLGRYFRDQVTQDQRRRATACYVAIEERGARIAGFDTPAAAGVPLSDKLTDRR